jgi:hypothetical protein
MSTRQSERRSPPALVMEAWLRIAAGKDFGDRDASVFLRCAELIARARVQ